MLKSTNLLYLSPKPHQLTVFYYIRPNSWRSYSIYQLSISLRCWQLHNYDQRIVLNCNLKQFSDYPSHSVPVFTPYVFLDDSFQLELEYELCQYFDSAFSLESEWSSLYSLSQPRNSEFIHYRILSKLLDKPLYCKRSTWNLYYSSCFELLIIISLNSNLQHQDHSSTSCSSLDQQLDLKQLH